MFPLGLFPNRFFEKRFFPKGYLDKHTGINPSLAFAGIAKTGDIHTLTPKTSNTSIDFIPMEQE